MMQRIFGITALGVFLCVACAPSASANTIYTYTGNPFNQFLGVACPPQCNISGSFTVAQPLAANLAFATITPISFSFTDGNFTITQANLNSSVVSGLPFQFFSTNASGSITTWCVDLGALASGGFAVKLKTGNAQSCLSALAHVSDLTELFLSSNVHLAIAGAVVSNNPGVWSVSTTAKTPEPGSFLLLGTGLLGLVSAARRRLRN